MISCNYWINDYLFPEGKEPVQINLQFSELQSTIMGQETIFRKRTFAVD